MFKRMATNLDTQPTMTHTVVHEQKLHPFPWQKVQAQLGPKDYLCQDQVFIGLHTRVQRSLVFPQWCCSWMRPAAPERGFSTATTAMFGQKQTLMLHLFIATNNTLWSMFGWTMNFWLGLTCYPDSSVHRFTATRNTGGNPVVSQEKCGFRQQGCASLCMSHPRTSHRHLQQSLDWTRQANGLASQVTGPHTRRTASYGATLKPWFTYR